MGFLTQGATTGVPEYSMTIETSALLHDTASSYDITCLLFIFVGDFPNKYAHRDHSHLFFQMSTAQSGVKPCIGLFLLFFFFFFFGLPYRISFRCTAKCFAYMYRYTNTYMYAYIHRF